jgi:hypothetical protein
MHPVDKVHVGVTGGAEHHPVAGGLAEARMRGPVLDADVGLDLDDPPDPASRRIVADQAGPEEGATGLQAGTGQDRSIDDVRAGQRSG